MSMQKPENLLYENSSYLPPRHGKDVARVRSRREYEDLCQLARTNPSEFWASRARSKGGTRPVKVKLFDSELKVMDVLWREGERPARQVAAALEKEVGWNVNTTYTLLKRCIKKGAVQRTEPGFLCRALISREEVQAAETDELVGKLFDGSVDKLFASLLGRKNLSAEQIARLLEIVGELE